MARMKKWTYSYTLWVSFLLQLINLSKEDLFVEVPKINGKMVIQETLQRGSNYSAKCVSEYPIMWKTFQGFKGTAIIANEEDENVKFRYKSTLHLYNVTYRYVGHYFCVTKQMALKYDYSIQMAYQEEVGRHHFSGLNPLYIYVNDTGHPLVYQENPKVTIVDDRHLVLPCKPTFRDIQAKLYDQITRSDYDDKNYYPTIGFVLGFNSTEEVYGLSLECAIQEESMFFKIEHRLPEIQSLTGYLRTEGDNLILKCSFPILNDQDFDMAWECPNKNCLNEYVEVTSRRKRYNVKIAINTLTIDNVNTADTGYYKCQVIDHQKNQFTKQIFIDVMGKTGGDTLEIYTLDGNYAEEISEWQKRAVLQARYKGRPNLTVTWLDNKREVIKSTKIHNVSVENGLTTLEIPYVSYVDSGNYTLIVNNTVASTNKTFGLLVKVAPYIEYITNQVKDGNVETFTLSVIACPVAIITCTIAECKMLRNALWCNQKISSKIEDKHIQTRIESAYKQSTVVTFVNTTEFGRIECAAVNSEGIQSKIKYLAIDRNETKLRIRGPDGVVTAGDNVALFCEAGIHRYYDLQLTHNDRQINNGTNRTMIYEKTKTLHRIQVTWTGITRQNGGIYRCSATDSILRFDNATSSTKVSNFRIQVREATAPTINGKADEQDDVSGTVDQWIPLVCNVVGQPVPEVKWYQNEVPIVNSQRLSVEGHTLVIKRAQMEDAGDFKCVGRNRIGCATKIFHLKMISNVQSWIAGFVALVLLLTFIICTIFFLAKVRRFQRELSAAGLDHFEKGNLESFNPDVALHDQAYLLPYNRRYEFPKEQLKLGKQLGAGAFGIVLQACATGIKSRFEETTVAVKMLKEAAGNEEVRALVGELKILVNLGQHLNIVNLLGAVTENIIKRQVMVIVEYCCFGNLQNFLLNNRASFVDQINTENDCIDPTISKSEQSLHNGNNQQILNYCQLCQLDSGFSETSFTSSHSDDKLSITTSDLLCWLFQVTMGMKYLTSRKVLHGDLAARNVLLSEGNVVKICDFGLARSLHKCDVYKKQGNAPLPIKWLAIECVRDRVFSTLSDVWSFGIVMWEFFSLGATPYPGFSPNEDLINKVIAGYRMEKPKYATQKIYDIMLHCWNLNPASRPQFDVLESKLKEILEREVVENYVRLNEQYVEINARAFGQGQTDILALMASPQEAVSTSPNFYC